MQLRTSTLALALACTLASHAAAAADPPIPNQAPEIRSGKGWPSGFNLHVVFGTTVDPQLTASDFEDGDLTARIELIEGDPTTTSEGRHRLTYAVRDKGNLTSTYTLLIDALHPSTSYWIPYSLPTLLPVQAQTGQRTITAGQSISRTVRIESSAQPVAVVFPTFQINEVHIQSAQSNGTSRKFQLKVTRQDTGQVVFDQPTTLQEGTTLTLGTPLNIRFDVDYLITLEYLEGTDPLEFRTTADGTWWMQLAGTATYDVYRRIVISAPEALNQLAWDPGRETRLKTKMLGSNDIEVLDVTKFADDLALTYAVADPTIATVSASTSGNVDRLMLAGVREGETLLRVYERGKYVDSVRLIVTRPKNLLLSYSYIAFPGEGGAYLKSAGPDIMRAIRRNFAPYNIRVLWRDHGVLTHEWDANGNGLSSDGTEVWRAFDANVIPDPATVFSNVFLLRHAKSDATTCNADDGGASRGMGATSAAPRGALQAVCASNAVTRFAPHALTRELGRNLGLQEYEGFFSNSNFMVDGWRADSTFYPEQWRTMHSTLEARLTAKDAGVQARMGVTARQDYDGNGVSDVFWRNATTGANELWRAANSGTKTPVTGVTNPAWQVVAQGDFDGDGVSDLFWRNNREGWNAVWRSADFAKPRTVTGVTNLAWQVVAAGDFDGDGISDVFWRNTANGQNAIWRSADNTTQVPVAAVTSQDWQVVGAGDFNADGRSDVLWRNRTTGANTIWLSGNSATTRAVTGVTNLQWKIAGIGDFNKDGASDILWRNAQTGANTIWRSANSATLQNVTGVTNFAWQIVGVADYNGDGHADIFWRKSDGTNAIWRSANSATQQAMASFGTMWSAVPSLPR